MQNMYVTSESKKNSSNSDPELFVFFLQQQAYFALMILELFSRSDFKLFCLYSDFPF